MSKHFVWIPPSEICVCVTSGDWDIFLLKPLPENHEWRELFQATQPFPKTRRCSNMRKCSLGSFKWNKLTTRKVNKSTTHKFGNEYLFAVQRTTFSSGWGFQWINSTKTSDQYSLQSAILLSICDIRKCTFTNICLLCGAALSQKLCIY